jgi:LacI family transcriptional regulator
VAERAGVSVTTVSRVLNGRDDAISAETRERVLKAARQLRYRPNSLAVALRKGVTHTIGLIVPDIGDAYFHQVARGLEDAAQLAGYTVILCNTDRVAARERSSIEVLCDQHVDAIVFAGGGIDDDKHLADFPWDGMHVVAVGPHNLECPSIRVDDAGTIELAVNHLVEQGCRRVLCLAGMENWLINSARLEGYRRAIAHHGMDYDPQLVRNGSFRVESGREMVASTIADGVDFDGIVAFNDYSAIGAMQALAEHGRRVPEDIAVVGCDDVPVASLVQPALTSVSFPQYDFGRAAMQVIQDLIAGRPVAEVTTFPYHLEVRGSSRRLTPTAG